ncbi:MAG: Trm112 family protein [Propionibacteriales bacterium]|nr:Trm112 family protein [Propionibacteriales bacterium]
MNVDPGLLEILVCPACRAGLAVNEDTSELLCTGCGLAFPVHDDIPVLLVDEARRPDDESASDETAARPDDQGE